MAMESNPDIVTIMLGTNDAKGCNWDYGNDGVQGKGDLYKNDYADFIAELKALPSRPKVFVVSPPPLFSPWPYNMSAHAINMELPTLLRKVRRKGMRSFYLSGSPLDTPRVRTLCCLWMSTTLLLSLHSGGTHQGDATVP